MRVLAFAIALLAGAVGAAQGALPLVNVAHVDDKDTLNLHASPDAKSPKTGAFGPHETGLAVVAIDSKHVEWVKVQKGAATGWVNSAFLSYDTGTPVRLTCSGAEPFWSMTVGYGVAEFTYDGRTSRMPLDAPKSVAGASSPWLLAVRGKPGLFLLANTPEGECQDDSGSKTPYAIYANTAGMFVTGCCS